MNLVTGATGHLGANLVRRLLEDGEPVRVLLREGTETRAVDGLAVERVVGDIRDYGRTLAAVRGCRRVYHCAAKVSNAEGQEREIYETNVVGTRHVLRAAVEAMVERVVVTGSFSAVGHDPARPVDETVPVGKKGWHTGLWEDSTKFAAPAGSALQTFAYCKKGA